MIKQLKTANRVINLLLFFINCKQIRLKNKSFSKKNKMPIFKQGAKYLYF